MEKLVCKFSSCTAHLTVQSPIRTSTVYVDTTEIARINAVAAGWQASDNGMWCPKHRLLTTNEVARGVTHQPTRGKQNRSPRNEHRVHR